MRILFIISGLSSGGAEHMLLKLLEKIDRQRFQPEVISLTSKGEIGLKIENLGIKVHAFELKSLGGALRSIVQMIKMIRVIQPSLVHTWMYHADLLGGIAARLARVKLVWGIRHSDLSLGKNKLLTLIIVKICALLSYVLPTRILGCSSRAMRIHAKFGYKSTRMTVIPNGFDLRKFFPVADAKKNIRHELDISDNAKLVGLVGRFHSQKNIPGFIDAAIKILTIDPEVRFVMVGTGLDPHNDVLVNLLRQGGCAQQFHLLGRRTDIPKIMSALNVLVLTSHGEAFPNVLGEAMSCGTPCVVTDVGDSADIVSETGIVVAPGDMQGVADGVLKILEMSDTEITLLGDKARDRIQKYYEISHVVKLHEQFYESVVNEVR